MLKLTLHDAHTAPEGSVETITTIEGTYGFVPNLVAVLANAPAAVDGYAQLSKAFASSSLAPLEQQIVLLTTSFENRCHYCMAAHSLAAASVGADADTVEALRSGTTLVDPRLEALRTFTGSVVRNRGFVPDGDLTAFLDAGFNEAQVLEVVVGVTQKTLSNYVNHLAHTPLDKPFQKAAWTHPDETVVAVA